MSTVTPCGQLGAAALVARVASTMDAAGISHPSYELRPGFCRFCNHALAYALSATGYVNGEVKRAEWNPGDAIGDKIQLNPNGMLELGNGTALVYLQSTKAVRTERGLRSASEFFPDILLAPNGACEALTNDVFRQASTIVRERTAKVRLDQQVKANAHQIAAQKAAKIAANQLAGSLVKPHDF